MGGGVTLAHREMPKHGHGYPQLRRGISLAWRHDRLGNQRGNEERDPGFIAEQMATLLMALNALNHGERITAEEEEHDDAG